MIAGYFFCGLQIHARQWAIHRPLAGLLPFCLLPSTLSLVELISVLRQCRKPLQLLSIDWAMVSPYMIWSPVVLLLWLAGCEWQVLLSILFQIVGEKNMPPRSLALSKVARLYFYCMGFRGDWKALAMVFNLQRHYNQNQVFWRRYSSIFRVAICCFNCVHPIVYQEKTNAYHEVTRPLRSAGFAKLRRGRITWLSHLRMSQQLLAGEELG